MNQYEIDQEFKMVQPELGLELGVVPLNKHGNNFKELFDIFVRAYALKCENEEYTNYVKKINLSPVDLNVVNKAIEYWLTISERTLSGFKYLCKHPEEQVVKDHNGLQCKLCTASRKYYLNPKYDRYGESMWVNEPETILSDTWS